MLSVDDFYRQELNDLTNTSQEYFEAWLKTNNTPPRTPKSESTIKDQFLARTKLLSDLQDLLAVARSKPIPNAPRFPDLGCMKQPFRSGMDPAMIIDPVFRKRYEEFLGKSKQINEILIERSDLEYTLRSLEYVFISTYKSDLGVQKTKALIRQEIQNKELRKYLLALFS